MPVERIPRRPRAAKLPPAPPDAQAELNHKSPLTVFNEYLPPGPDNEEVHRARQKLIGATKWCVPTFLQELSTRVFPLYEELAESGYDFDGIAWSPSAYELLDKGLKQALTDWAIRFHAQEEWLMVGALQTMCGWRTTREWREQLKWHTVPVHFVVALTSKEFSFRYPAWDVQSQQWSTYHRGVLENLKQALAEYERETRESAEAAGLRRHRREHSPKNIEWFSLYQFGGKSPKEIADTYGYKAAESTVLKGIKSAAKLLAWDRLR